jgi:circadian clock protein KaiC
MHLVTMHKAVDEFRPAVVVVDPISNLMAVGTATEGASMLTRLIDFLKCDGITAMFTDLIHGGALLETTNEEFSSLIDTWISLRDMEVDGERNRGLQIIKSRGMAHSNQIREFLLTSKGIDLLDVYLGPAGVLTGSARIAQEAAEKADTLVQQQQQVRKEHERRRKGLSLERQMAELRAQSEMEAEEGRQIGAQEEALAKTFASNRNALAQLRGTDQFISRNQNGNGK